MDPVAALRQIAFFKDRAGHDARRVMAYRKAADIVAALDDQARDRLGRTGDWRSLPGIGPKTATVIAQAWAGREPGTLVELRSTAEDFGGGRSARRFAATCTVIRTGRTARRRSRRWHSPRPH